VTRWLIPISALLALTGCYASHGVLEDFECPEGEPDAPEDVPPVDLLFVVDDSESMEEEQEALRLAFDDLLRWLVTGDVGDDGIADFPAIADLHVGVVTTDLGVPIGSSCGRGAPGGALRGTECGGPPAYVAVDPMSPDASVERFACAASVGTSGCAVEQPLEAALLATNDEVDGAAMPELVGQAGRTNRGFLRPGSVRIVVIVTDEDDASIADPVFYRETIPGGPAARARAEAAAAHPIARYVEAFTRMGAEGGGFGLEIVAGVPPELVGSAPTAILSHPRMQRRYAPTSLTGIESSCRSDRGVAYPPRRLVEAAGELGERASIHSLCEADFGAVAVGIADHVGAIVRRATCER